MEQEVILSGIGGQGIQLLGKSLALAATMVGQYAMLADYGGEMRGGPSQASVVIGDAPLRSLPILPSSGAAVLMHHKFSAFALERLRPDGLLVLNTSIVPADSVGHPGRVAGFPVTAMAQELGAPQSAGFVMLGAYAGLTAVVAPDVLEQAMRRLLPPYRAQYGDVNARAIEAGLRSAVPGGRPSGPPRAPGGPGRPELKTRPGRPVTAS
jgi:2-oxoglutarate ferredoxin oxidoreductase subunit gamma